MSAGIVAGVDLGLVGMEEAYGLPWHRMAEYESRPGPLEIPDIREILSYHVVAVPLKLHAPNHTFNDQRVPTMVALVEEATGRVLHEQSVSPKYCVFQNEEFLNRVEALIPSFDEAFPNFCVESAGTLFGKRVAFVNFLLDCFHYDNDDSETITRVMYSNAFGGRSVYAGGHNVHVVCANTENLANMQSAANGTLGKYKHTSGVVDRVGRKMVDLTEVAQALNVYKQMVNRLTHIPMDTTDVDNYLAHLFPIPTGSKQATVTTRTNKRERVREIFETDTSLQGRIAHTRFAAFQSLTFYTNHEMGNSDAAFNFSQLAVGDGERSRLNKQALSVLSKDEITAPQNQMAVA